MTIPVLWSFRRCPYAMRARLALASAGQQVELREVVLRDKPQAFLETSPSATVPCLDTGSGVIDESLDIMIWALERNDPEGLADMPGEGHALIQFCDGPFKTALDRYKYPTRYEGVDPISSRDAAMRFVERLEAQPVAGVQGWLARFKASERFAAIMRKYPQWQPGAAGQPFPES